ncbi:trypsin-like serine protease [Clostridium perfringens]|nr:trypsin-like serine protease [Clostridium perfringens]
MSHNPKEEKDLFFNINEDTLHDLDQYFEPVIIKKKRNFKKLIIPITLVVCFGGGFLLNEFMPRTNNSGNTNLAQIVENNDNKQNTSGNTNNNPNEKNNEATPKNKENMSTEEVVKLVSPAVVTINVSSGYAGNGKQGLGTGFIVNKDGTIVTNYHVIENASNIKITFSNGNEANATVIAASKQYDLAILKVEGNMEMPGIAKLADNDNINAGQDILAIGNPLGKEFSGTVTKGIISSTSRTVNIDGIEKEFIQIDAPINPGNSGGPLINLQGEIIGVNTAKKTGENVEGMGFAVPIKHVKEILNNLDKYKNDINDPGDNGTFNSPNYENNPNYDDLPNYPNYDNSPNYPNYENNPNYGNSPYNDKSYTNGFKLGIQVVETPNGLMVVNVSSGSYGEKLGLKSNDIIIGANGQKISSSKELKSFLASVQSNGTLTFEIVRNGQKLNLKLTI